MNSFYKDSIIQILKPDKHSTQKRENYRPTSLRSIDAKKPQQIISKLNPRICIG